MQIIENEHICVYDVDQTLFMHDSSISNGLYNPYSKSFVGGYQNYKHIELMKQHKARGMFIIVWSKAGSKWAEAVIKYLKLEEYVDLILTKPDKYIDDMNGNSILGEHIYLK